MTRARIFLFDTTLRDGAQTQGVDFSVEDKRQIALALDGFGIDYIEGGWPGANPTDTAFFAQDVPLKHARRVAFGMTKRAGTPSSRASEAIARRLSSLKAVAKVSRAGRRLSVVDTLVSGKGNSRTLEMVSTHCACDAPPAAGAGAPV